MRMEAGNRIRHLGRAVATASAVFALPAFGSPVSRRSPAVVTPPSRLGSMDHGAREAPVRSSLAPPSSLMS
jgi:hypothetical protein